MPLATWIPAVPRRGRCWPVLFLGLALAALASFIVRHSQRTQAPGLCHSSLSRLSAVDGREVLLVGALALDLDGASGELVRSALDVLRPDVVMIEGTWTAGVNAMVLSGGWEMHGAPPAPKKLNWTDTGDTPAVELPQPKRRGFLGFRSPPARYPDRSLVPVKVGQWAHHLRGSVGGDMAAAIAVAAKRDVPLHFLGPQDGGFQGHVQVSLLAQQAASELLEEEQQRGSQLPPEDVDSALRRAESHVREEADKWLHDARSETTRLNEHMSERMPAKAREAVAERIEVRTQGLADRIARTMEEHQRGAVVLAVDQLVSVEAKLINAGYTYVSNCA